MAKFFAFIFLLFIVALTFIWAIFIPKENINQKISKKLESQKKKSDLLMKGVVFSEIVNGVKYWEIKSKSSEINKESGIAKLNETDGTFFKKGAATFKITAPNVLWKMRSKEILINSPFGYNDVFKFKTKNLYWSIASKKISGRKEIVIEKEGIIIKARGFSADTGLDDIILKGRPKAQVKVSEGEKPLFIESDQFKMDGRMGIISAVGSSYIKKDGLLIKCSILKYHEKQKKIYAIKDVQIFYKDIFAKTDSASYNINDRKIFLTGHAKAMRGKNTLKGEQLIIDLKNNKISVRGRTKAFIEEEIVTKEMR